MEKIVWKVGDVVWVKNDYTMNLCAWSKTTIVKATEKTATTEFGYKLRQGATEGETSIGSGPFNSVRYYPDSIATKIKVRQSQSLTYAHRYELIKGEVEPEVVAEIVKIHKDAMLKIKSILDGKV